MKRHIHFSLFIILYSCCLSYGVYGQQTRVTIGAFEFAGDIYVSYQDKSNNRFLSKKVEGYLSQDVLASTLKTPVDVIYSSKYQRIYAIYQTKNQKFIAHAIHEFVDTPADEMKVSFGVIKNPADNKSIAVFLNNQNKIIAFSLE